MMEKNEQQRAEIPIHAMREIKRASVLLIYVELDWKSWQVSSSLESWTTTMMCHVARVGGRRSRKVWKRTKKITNRLYAFVVERWTTMEQSAAWCQHQQPSWCQRLRRIGCMWLCGAAAVADNWCSHVDISSVNLSTFNSEVRSLNRRVLRTCSSGSNVATARWLPRSIDSVSDTWTAAISNCGVRSVWYQPLSWGFQLFQLHINFLLTSAADWIANVDRLSGFTTSQLHVWPVYKGVRHLAML